MADRVPSIRFADGQFSALRERLLSDLSQESFAVILAKRNERFPDIYCTISARFPDETDIISRSIGHIELSKQFIHGVLGELVERFDVDTIIDVHTHPFSTNLVHFSSVDDDDERRFYSFLAERLPGVHYGSVVLGQNSHEARIWSMDAKGRVTQTEAKLLPSSGTGNSQFENDVHQNQPLLARAELAVGINALRRIAQAEKVAIIGAGGLGSIVAENLVQMGFSNLVIVDPDIVELSNLGRIVGARESDAHLSRRKVTTLKRHLRGINSKIVVNALPYRVEDKQVLPGLIDCTYIVVCTDNHTSRYYSQRLSQDLFIPLISAGVNITVKEGVVTDISGEVINCRIGSGFCLICLGRINHMKMLVESDPNSTEGRGLVGKGYVSGLEVQEPAVKTLNSIIAALTVDTLVNEFSRRQLMCPILVYETNASPIIYQDRQTFDRLDAGCSCCEIADNWS